MRMLNADAAFEMSTVCDGAGASTVGYGFSNYSSGPQGIDVYGFHVELFVCIILDNFLFFKLTSFR